MAQNQEFDDDNDDNIFGKSEKADSVFDDEVIVKPGKDTGAQPATEEDKQKAKESGKAETEESKKARALREEQEKFKKESEEEWNGKAEGKEKPASTTTTTTSEPLEGLEATVESFYELGILNKFDENEDPPKTEEELIERLHLEQETRAEELVYEFAGKHGEEYRKAFDAIFVQGANPEEYFLKFNEVRSFKNMDLTDESNQIKVVETSLRNQGLEEDFIKNKIKTLRNNAELENEALGYHKGLVRKEEEGLVKMAQQAETLRVQREKEEKAYDLTVRQVLSEKLRVKDFDGVPISKEIAEKAYDLLTNKDWKLADGTLVTKLDIFMLQLNQPANWAEKAKLATLIASDYDPRKPIKLNLSQVKKAAESEQAKSYFNKSRLNNPKVNREEEKHEKMFNDL